MKCYLQGLVQHGMAALVTLFVGGGGNVWLPVLTAVPRSGMPCPWPGSAGRRARPGRQTLCPSCPWSSESPPAVEGKKEFMLFFIHVEMELCSGSILVL